MGIVRLGYRKSRFLFSIVLASAILFGSSAIAKDFTFIVDVEATNIPIQVESIEVACRIYDGAKERRGEGRKRVYLEKSYSPKSYSGTVKIELDDRDDPKLSKFYVCEMKFEDFRGGHTPESFLVKDWGKIKEGTEPRYRICGKIPENANRLRVKGEYCVYFVEWWDGQ